MGMKQCLRVIAQSESADFLSYFTGECVQKQAKKNSGTTCLIFCDNFYRQFYAIYILHIFYKECFDFLTILGL